MNNRILVTGGTGLLGRLVVERLSARGHEVRVMSRTPHRGCMWTVADLRSGEGVREAVADVDVIVHCATAFGRRAEARITQTLVAAARHAGRPHLAYISIVGVDRVPLGYYRGKLAAERTIAGSGLPHTILRATQFHDMLRALFAKAAKTPVMPIPDFRFQPVDAGEVADRLTELATGEPTGRVPDFGGPHVHHARDLARTYLLATGRRRLVLPISLPGRTFRAYRDGGHLAPGHSAGLVTFEDHLATHTYSSYRGQS